MSVRTRKSAPPAGLGDAGRRLWDEITRQVADDGLELDARDKRLLRDASFTADDLERLEVALKEAAIQVVGSTGQPVPNRLWDETRKARQLIASLLRQLDLSDPETSARKGTGSATTSTSARAAAAVRWRGSGVGL